jgi:hypothetical protein
MTLRNLAPVTPLVAQWDWPLFRRADGLDPNRLKQAGGRLVSHSRPRRCGTNPKNSISIR